MFCPWKKSCAVGRIGLYTFLRFASSLRRICSTRIWNVDVNIDPAASAHFIRALTPISKDDQSLPKRKNRWSAAKDQKGSYVGKIVNKIPLCANYRFYCSELWMIRFLEDPFIVAPFCCGVSVHAIRSDKKPVIYAFLRGTITIKWRWSLSFMQKTTWFYKITRHISPIYLINSRALWNISVCHVFCRWFRTFIAIIVRTLKLPFLKNQIWSMRFYRAFLSVILSTKKHTTPRYKQSTEKV